MNSAAIRQQLHQFIDTADERQIQDLLEYIDNAKGRTYSCTQEELNLLHERAEKYLSGTGTTFSVEEAHEYIRNSRKKP